MVALVFVAFFLLSVYCQIENVPIDSVKEIINPMNKIRADYCLPPVIWDDNLAALADIWARQCSFSPSDSAVRELNYYDILNRKGLPIPNPLKTGENIAAAFGQEATSDVWEDQQNDYDCAANTCDTSSNNTCDSFIQLVTLNTFSVGCSRYICDINSPFPGAATPWRILVCNYYFAGAEFGQRPFPANQCVNCSAFVPTNAPTKAPTPAPTEAPTTGAPTPPTEAPTRAPTEAPTAPTNAPTAEPSSAPTPPTEAPIEPTDAPTPAPTSEPEREPIDIDGDIIEPINELRAEYCLPPIAWDDNLAELADVYASTCPWSRSDRLSRATLYQAILVFHSEPVIKPLFTGETLAATIGQSATPHPWIVQQDNWDCVNNTCEAGKKCDSFTQMVDLVTTRVGCSRYLCSNPSPFPSGQAPWRLIICEFFFEQNTTAPNRPFPVNYCKNCKDTVPTFSPTAKPTKKPTRAPTTAPTPPTESPTGAPVVPPPPTIPPPTTFGTPGPTGATSIPITNSPSIQPTSKPTTVPEVQFPTTLPPPPSAPTILPIPTDLFPGQPTAPTAPTVPTVPTVISPTSSLAPSNNNVPTSPTDPNVPTAITPTNVNNPTNSPPPTDPVPTSNEGLSTAAVIGIVVGVVLAFIIIVALIALIVAKALGGGSSKAPREYELL